MTFVQMSFPEFLRGFSWVLEEHQTADAAVSCSGVWAVQGAADAALCLQKCPWAAAVPAFPWESPASPPGPPRLAWLCSWELHRHSVFVERCDSPSIEAPSSLCYNVGSLYCSLYSLVMLVFSRQLYLFFVCNTKLEKKKISEVAVKRTGFHAFMSLSSL